MTIRAIILAAILAALLIPEELQACCGFQIKSGDTYIQVYNMQGGGDTLGLVCLNQRGVKKRSLSNDYLDVKSGIEKEPLLNWTSKYGSLPALPATKRARTGFGRRAPSSMSIRPRAESSSGAQPMPTRPGNRFTFPK